MWPTNCPDSGGNFAASGVRQNRLESKFLKKTLMPCPIDAASAFPEVEVPLFHGAECATVYKRRSHNRDSGIRRRWCPHPRAKTIRH